MSNASEAIRDAMIDAFNLTDNDWTRQFARSVIRQSHTPNWTPSPKQRAMIDRLTTELKQAKDDGFDLFEQTGNTGHIDTTEAA